MLTTRRTRGAHRRGKGRVRGWQRRRGLAGARARTRASPTRRDVSPAEALRCAAAERASHRRRRAAFEAAGEPHCGDGNGNVLVGPRAELVALAA